MTEASYLSLARSGELRDRAARLERMLAACTVCPRACAVDRHVELGECSTPAGCLVASWGPHFGEEPPLSGRRGSGTVFLANCNLSCVFCQNSDISQAAELYRDNLASPTEVAAIMLELEARGCHNINWVSPTHQVPQLVAALADAAEHGLTVPIVYNSNGYDSTEVLELLDGVVDIYLPDLKYAVADAGRRLSKVADYPVRARAALREMYRQVGPDWVTGGDGTLRRGLFVRILVLPGEIAGVEESLRWIAESLSAAVAISLMSQYRPANLVRAGGCYADLARRLSAAEYQQALAALRRHNTSPNSFVQPPPP